MPAPLSQQLKETDAESVLLLLCEYGNLSKACREANVDKATFLRWCDRSPDNANRYARSRESGLDTEADRAIEEAQSAEDAAKGRLVLDARKWYLSKLLPKKYGDKLALGGADDLPALRSEVSVAGLSESALRELANLGKGNV